MVQLITLTTDDLKNIIIESVSQALNGPETAPAGTQPEQPEYLTRKQTADKLHISLGTLDTYTKLGILSAVKIGHRVLYRTEDLNEAFTEKIGSIKNKSKG